MMVEMGISPYLTLIAMAIGGNVLVGAWQDSGLPAPGPPFIVTWPAC